MVHGDEFFFLLLITGPPDITPPSMLCGAPPGGVGRWCIAAGSLPKHKSMGLFLLNVILGLREHNSSSSWTSETFILLFYRPNHQSIKYLINNSCSPGLTTWRPNLQLCGLSRLQMHSGKRRPAPPALNYM